MSTDVKRCQHRLCYVMHVSPGSKVVHQHYDETEQKFHLKKLLTLNDYNP